MKKFAFIGAGSFAFTRNVIRDLLTFPAFADSEFALMDIDPERLEGIRRCVQKIVDASGKPARVTTTLNRAEALTGADGVLCTVFNGDVADGFGTDMRRGIAVVYGKAHGNVLTLYVNDKKVLETTHDRFAYGMTGFAHPAAGESLWNGFHISGRSDTTVIHNRYRIYRNLTYFLPESHRISSPFLYFLRNA